LRDQIEPLSRHRARTRTASVSEIEDGSSAAPGGLGAGPRA
jgi:hypothetical protein